ncbi:MULTISPECIES: DUF2997 domain-containing protein [Prochlorococcus]|uniref:DUF2997 domain-containing protein n=1 Tax=Prochlorococcus marinus (strain SARG / CCMP1375 / SS120) TaxID=167539 RepID=Q7VA34_PROMA|nr:MULTISPECIES: DUF2997 domain-containing protein [Prochlorococcus]AAQ00677.1 Uncharacterized protein Pro_1633 [Prochlorococcus marinus subsp. marinus str. CCMP1375]KGG20408.1 hypothetical protein EV08_0991 [Prochlorococcus marinus str. SS2]KGG24077.1 hypothetical protein EV09_0681 [Prochlorococcus marinus str. SS35]KGG31664.1 hypothetical protein EV10_1761 [Prochlorococcus marinus str. SS51]KGG34731.1 hypothetical protein EV11_1863 [Prochlorococcus sp. SS52]
MPQRTLRFRIRQDGFVEETVEGVLGQSCAQLTEKLESALGTVQHREPTSESYISSEELSQLLPDQIKIS